VDGATSVQGLKVALLDRLPLSNLRASDLLLYAPSDPRRVLEGEGGEKGEGPGPTPQPLPSGAVVQEAAGQVGGVRLLRLGWAAPEEYEVMVVDTRERAVSATVTDATTLADLAAVCACDAQRLVGLLKVGAWVWVRLSGQAFARA
jgi:hypothetical protein